MSINMYDKYSDENFDERTMKRSTWNSATGLRVFFLCTFDAMCLSIGIDQVVLKLHEKPSWWLPVFTPRMFRYGI